MGLLICHRRVIAAGDYLDEIGTFGRFISLGEGLLLADSCY